MALIVLGDSMSRLCFYSKFKGTDLTIYRMLLRWFIEWGVSPLLVPGTVDTDIKVNEL
jgi:hypothetical protein